MFIVFGYYVLSSITATVSEPLARHDLCEQEKTIWHRDSAS
jgi:hypothetical protein